MDIKTRFNLGDPVFAISQMQAVRLVFCKTCQQKGEVEIQGDKYTCPRCNGKCLHPQQRGEEWFISEESVVGKISTEHTTPSKYINCWHDSPFRIYYMIDATGIGTGRTWDESLLYPSRKDAQDECDRRNSLLNLKDDTLPSGVSV